MLRVQYERQKSLYGRTIRFVTVAQALGENEREYLLRLEQFSRTMGFSNNHDHCKQFTVPLAVDELREASVRSELMKADDA